MNNDNLEISRKRHQNLLIVEGEHEKNKLFQLIFEVFPEMDIAMEDVLIYGTNIYMLYNDIVKEYDYKWYDEDVDLPFIVGKKKGIETILNKKDFINIYLIFDYEHHDPCFSEQKIEIMQRYFNDSADMGKLYINYPMIESYQHFSCMPDANYTNLKVSVTLQPGSQYKCLVKQLFIAKLINLPIKIQKILHCRYGIEEDKCKIYARKILEISNPTDLVKQINQILIDDLPDSKLNTAQNQIANLIESKEYIQESINYCVYMRKLFKQIVLHNIDKGSKMQDIYLSDNDKKSIFELLDLNEILKVQNNVSKDEALGYIWVLNTCVFIIPDYNYELVQ